MRAVAASYETQGTSAKWDIKARMTIRIYSLVTVAALLSAALVIAPSLMSLATHPKLTTGLVFESSVFSADYAHFFHELLFGHSIWLWGQYGIVLINYFPLYLIHWTLSELLGSQLVAYHMMVILAQLAALISFAALCESWSRGYPAAGNPTFRRVAAWVLGALFLSSLANFNYLKSNVLFALPYYSLPIQLFLVNCYLRSRNCRLLLALMAVVLTMNTFNLTHFIYIQGLVLAYTLSLADHNSAASPLRPKWWTALWVGAAFIPAAILTSATWIVNLPYYGSLGEVSTIMAEDMYSQNAGILKALLQTTDWGLFGQFNGELYYEYSPYYLHELSMLFGLVFPITVIFLGLLFIVNRDGGPARLIVFWGLVALGCLFFLLGDKNPLFDWLYEHILLFRIFRNVTKLSAMLVFAMVALAFLLCLGSRMRTTKVITLAAAITGAFAYNFPYWFNADYFFRDRSVQEIPAYWHDAGDFLAQRASSGSRVLMLPATYINDIYSWNKKKNWVQGSLPDALWSVRTYRLSEGFVGPPRMQREMRETFHTANSLPRLLTVDPDMLESFTSRNGFDFLVFNKDLVDDYRFAGPFQQWAKGAGYITLAEFGPLTILHNPKNHRPLLTATNDFTYSRIDHLTYRLTLKHVRGPVALVFREEFRPGWRLAVDVPGQDKACFEQCPSVPLFFHFLDLSTALAGDRIAAKHWALADGSNAWMLDSATLEAAGDMRENADGSRNVPLIIHFAPQLGFVVMIWAFLASLGVCVLAFGYARKPRQQHIGEEANIRRDHDSNSNSLATKGRA